MNTQVAPLQPTPAPIVPKAEESTSIISSLSVASRIPEFWPENPRLWFLQVEAILTPQKTSDANKYFMVVAKLGKDVIQQVADIVASPPENNKFEALKDRLMQIYEESEARQIQKLISEIELGDQRPSQLLRRMKELARGKIENDTLKILWQGHLPAPVRAVLTVTSAKDLEELAVIADKVMETHQPAQVSEVARSNQETTTAFDVATIMAEIAKINLKIAVERWNRCVKVSLMARLKDNKNWIHELPCVMLGLRAAIKLESGVSAAQMVYGRSLRLPGEFFVETNNNLDPHTVVENIRNNIKRYKPLNMTSNSSTSFFVHPDIKDCTHVFLRVDKVKKSLTCPYEGPYKVLKRSEKVYKIQLEDRILTVSIDRLKPAYLLKENEWLPNSCLDC